MIAVPTILRVMIVRRNTNLTLYSAGLRGKGGLQWRGSRASSSSVCHITEDLTWSSHHHSCENGTASPLLPQEAETIWNGPFHSCTIESILPDWFYHRLGWQLHHPQTGGPIEGGADSPANHWVRAPSHPRPKIFIEDSRHMDCPQCSGGTSRLRPDS